MASHITHVVVLSPAVPHFILLLFCIAPCLAIALLELHAVAVLGAAVVGMEPIEHRIGGTDVQRRLFALSITPVAGLADGDQVFGAGGQIRVHLLGVEMIHIRIA